MLVSVIRRSIGVTCLAALAAASASAANTHPYLRQSVVPRQHSGAVAAPQRPRLRPNLTGCTTNGTNGFVGGGAFNVAGGLDSGVLSGSNDQACDITSSIGAGDNNTIYGDGSSVAEESFIAGGEGNTVSKAAAFIGTGSANQVMADDGFIGTGFSNIEASRYAVIGGGGSNTITPLNGSTMETNGADFSLIGAGYQNKIQALVTNGAEYAVIGGGELNTVTGLAAAVGGGYANKANAAYATVPGGSQNSALGVGSFAAGIKSFAGNAGAFVWSDDAAGATQLKSSAANQFLVRASGGVHVYSNASLTSGVTLAPGSGTWASVSDRALKTNVVPLDETAILAKVAALPVSEWSYKSEDGVRHVGPMAQDFYAAFGVGEDDRHITTIDEDGIALAAIKGLFVDAHRKGDDIASLRASRARRDAEVGSLRRSVARRDADVAALQRQIARLTAAVAALERAGR